MTPKFYKTDDFDKDKLQAVKMFLHYALDHMKAIDHLKVNPSFLDSAAYLCHLAFELLLKGWHLYEFEQYKSGHDLIELSRDIDYLLGEDKILLKIIDRWFLRYPIDENTGRDKTTLEINGMSYYQSEVGTSELEKARNLFDKIWENFKGDKNLKEIIKNIDENPYKKGKRTLMRRKKQPPSQKMESIATER